MTHKVQVSSFYLFKELRFSQVHSYSTSQIHYIGHLETKLSSHSFICPIIADAYCVPGDLRVPASQAHAFQTTAWSCNLGVTLGRLLHLSKPHYPHLPSDTGTTYGITTRSQWGVYHHAYPQCHTWDGVGVEGRGKRPLPGAGDEEVLAYRGF